MMARLCPQGYVIGIEADHHVYELTRDNIAINGFRHARVIHAAASDLPGELTLFRRNTRSGNTSITPVDQGFTASMGELPVESFSVPTVRIDDLQSELNGRLDFIKIDVEGAEPLVISGASEVIDANDNISILMEWSPGQIQAAGFDVADFLESLAERGLTPFDLDKKGCTPLTFGQLANIPYRVGILLKHV